MKYPEKPIGSDGKPMTDEAYENLHRILAEFSLKYGNPHKRVEKGA